MRTARLAALLAAAAALLALPAAAGAAPCTRTYTDAGGFRWDFVAAGSFFGDVSNGGSPPGGPFGAAFGSSAFVVDVRQPDGSSPVAVNIDGNGCITDAAGWSFGPVSENTGSATFHGVRVERRFAIPPGADFTRWLTIADNPGNAPVSVQIDMRMQWAGTPVTYATSDGDAAWSVADRWIAERKSSPAASDPAVALLWDGAGGGDTYDSLTPGAGTSGGGPVWDLTLAPGQRKIIMSVAAQRPTTEAATQFATANADGRGLVAGLSGAELGDIVNWPVADTDGDGVPAAADRCPTVADPDQADTDGDGLGDACDPDSDGDGLPDTVEATLGTNRLATDSDADGRPDGADACPTLAGPGTPTGCPVAPAPVTVSSPLPLGLTLGAPPAVGRKALLRRGLAIRVTPARAASVIAQLVAVPPAARARAARAGEIVIGETRAARAAGRRSLTVRVARAQRALVRRGSRLLVRVTATDAAGVTAIRSRTVRVT